MKAGRCENAPAGIARAHRLTDRVSSTAVNLKEFMNDGTTTR